MTETTTPRTSIYLPTYRMASESLITVCPSARIGVNQNSRPRNAKKWTHLDTNITSNLDWFAVHKNILSCRLDHLNFSAFFMTREKFVFLSRKVSGSYSFSSGLKQGVRESRSIG